MVERQEQRDSTGYYSKGPLGIQCLIVCSDAEFRTQAYDAVVSTFASNFYGIEIEVLPPALSPADGRLVVRDESHVGIPKKVLKSAFLEAVQRFFRNRDTGDPNPQDSLRATSVILLFDPEHLTAANYRKRSLLAAAANQSDPNLHGIMGAVYSEMTFLNAILWSPLHRQTKSPTLWHHRWWLFDRIVPKVAMTGIQGISGGGTNLVRSELMTILKAAERHPNNYYVWQYARRLFSSRYMNVALRFDFERLHWATICDEIATWCLNHPSDTSGWSFLLWMLSSPESDGDNSYRVISRVLDFVEKLDWRREALWRFLETAVLIQNMPNKTQVEARFMQKHTDWKCYYTDRLYGFL